MNISYNGRISGETNEAFVKRVHPIRQEKLRKALESGDKVKINFWKNSLMKLIH